MALLSQLKRVVRTTLQSGASPATTVLDALLQLELSREFARLQLETRLSMPDNPAGHGYKVYSQADEDGILALICARLGIERGVFVEIGCGDGRENNTHFLLLNGWRGVWIDGSGTNIESIRSALPQSARLQVIEAMVTRENIASVLDPALGALGTLDVLSIDIDGNDLPIARIAATKFSPKVIVAEYNAKFPLPLAVGVAYDPLHTWQVDDYHGASLAAWIAALAEYQLVSCNLAGTNAFFVRRELARPFGDHPPERLYQPARFHLTAMRAGHAPTLSFLADNLTAEADRPKTRSST